MGFYPNHTLPVGSPGTARKPEPEKSLPAYFTRRIPFIAIQCPGKVQRNG